MRRLSAAAGSPGKRLPVEEDRLAGGAGGMGSNPVPDPIALASASRQGWRHKSSGVRNGKNPIIAWAGSYNPSHECVRALSLPKLLHKSIRNSADSSVSRYLN